MIKKSLLPIIFTILCTTYSPITLAETLTYKVMYRWGIINKQAGRATFICNKGTDGISRASMSARTEPWADRFYRVRDTLLSQFDTATNLPYSYSRIAHEGDSYANDNVVFTRQGDTTSATCVRVRRKKKDSPISQTETTLNATGNAVDLLSSFYYLRGLDFTKMNAEKPHIINIFSGKRKELLKIFYQGIESIKLDNNKIQCHKVIFTFTSDSGKTTSSPIKAWLSTDKNQIPIKIEGELKIGKVQCFLSKQAF